LAACVGGVLLARALPELPFPLGLGVAIALALAAALTPTRSASFLLLAALAAFACGWTTLRTRTASPHSLDLLLTESPALVRVEGIVLGPVRQRNADADPLAPPTARTPSCSLELSLRSLETDRGPRAASGRVRVYVRAPALPAVRPGDRVSLLGTLRAPERALNPGESDWLALARQRGSVGTVGVDHPDAVTPVPHAHAADAALAPVRRTIAAARARALRALAGDDHSSPRAALALALILGERTDALDDLRRTFARTGTAHLMAISGYHLMVLAAAVALAVRALGEHGGLEKLGVCAAVGVYLLLVPAEAPVVRAGIMVLALAGLGAIGRRGDALTTLAWAGVALLIWRPLDALSLGWQLTFGITALLLRLDAAWRAEDRLTSLAPRTLSSGLARRTRRTLVGTLACFAVGQPLIAMHTGTIAPLSWLAGLAATPVVVLTMLAGFVSVALGLVLPAAAAITAPVVLWLAERTHAIVAWFESWSWAWAEVPPVPWWWALPAAACAVVGAIGAPAWRGPALLGVLLAATTLPLIARSGLAPGVRFRVDMLSVGDGTCILLRSGRDALIWDAGSLRAGVDGWRLARAARALGVSDAATGVVTHANLDHFNALPDLGQALGTRRVLTTPRVVQAAASHPGAAALVTALESIDAEIVPLEPGQTFGLGWARAHVLWPTPHVPPGAPSNDASLSVVFRVPTAAGEHAALFVGDVQALGAEGVEREFIALLGPGVRPTLMEAPHHGAWNPQAAAVVVRLDPRVVLQSTGVRRASDPRWADIRDARHWRTTSTDGASFVEIMHDGRVRAGAAR
jgi:competence protein ComEC